MWYALTAPRWSERAFHYGALAAVTSASLAFGLAEGGAIPLGEGVAQRMLYAFGLTWLLLAQRWDLARIAAEHQPRRQSEEAHPPNQRPWLKR